MILNEYLKSDLNIDESSRRKGRKRFLFLQASDRRFRPRTWSKVDSKYMTERIEELGIRATAPPKQALLAAYDALGKKLDERFIMAKTRTYEERAFAVRLEHGLRMQPEKSVWIGNWNTDFFFPQVGGHGQKRARDLFRRGQRAYAGLAVEIDGPIHDHELKSKRDQVKHDLFCDLGIAVLVVENSDVHAPATIHLIRHLSDVHRLDSRGRDRLKYRIAAFTVCCAGSDDLFCQLFKITPEELVILRGEGVL